MSSSHVLGVLKLGTEGISCILSLHILVFLCLDTASLGSVLGIWETITL